MKIGFDCQKYIREQSNHILERISNFNKLYLEFGGKLFDDYHASRVLPGFEPDAKIQMLMALKDKAEIILAINANDVEKNKIRADLGINYSQDLFRLIDMFNDFELEVSGVVITHYQKQVQAQKLRRQLEKSGIKVAYHYPIENYPNDVELILSKDGFGKNEYLATSKQLVVVTAPGPGSGKLATCLSQMYHEHSQGHKVGYAKFETFPIWNLALNHPVNLAYEAATVDLNDVNMIDPYHYDAYQEITVNYNRDVEAFPVVSDLLLRISGENIYKSPTDMGVNMAGFCISDDEACKEAAKHEICRRYYNEKVQYLKENSSEDAIKKIEAIMAKANIDNAYLPCINPAETIAEKTKLPAMALQLPNDEIVYGKTTDLLGASSSCLLNALKTLAGLPDINLLSASIIEPVQKMKTSYLRGTNPRLHTDEVLIALAIQSTTSDVCSKAIECLPLLADCEAHSSVILSSIDRSTLKKLGVRLSESPVYENKRVLYHK